MKSLNLGGGMKADSSFLAPVRENNFELDLLTVGRKSHSVSELFHKAVFFVVALKLIIDTQLYKLQRLHKRHKSLYKRLIRHSCLVVKQQRRFSDTVLVQFSHELVTDIDSSNP